MIMVNAMPNINISVNKDRFFFLFHFVCGVLHVIIKTWILPICCKIFPFLQNTKEMFVDPLKTIQIEIKHQYPIGTNHFFICEIHLRTFVLV